MILADIDVDPVTAAALRRLPDLEPVPTLPPERPPTEQERQRRLAWALTADLSHLPVGDLVTADENRCVYVYCCVHADVDGVFAYLDENGSPVSVAIPGLTS